MAQKKVGELIKEARAKAGLSQEKLAGMVPGLSAAELGKAERGEKELTQAELKAIAKATGVTQKSLLEAPSGVKKTAAAKKPAAAAAKKPAAPAVRKTASGAAVKVTAAEKRMLELYRAADAAARKNAEAVLRGTKQVQEGNDFMGGLLGGALEAITGLGKK